MSDIMYEMYRVKFIKPSQKRLPFDPDIPTEELMLRAIKYKPSLSVRKGYSWHVGNVTLFHNAKSGFFAIGRTTKATQAKFDVSSKNFIEEVQENSPYTHVFFDCEIQLVLIGKNSILGRGTEGTANKIEQLFRSVEEVHNRGITVLVKPVLDPRGFIQKIHDCYAVKKFTAWFTGPNPLDADELFQKNLSVFAREAGADEGKASVQGSELNKDVLVEVTRSTVATGNKASASIVDAPNQRSHGIKLSGDPVKASFPASSHPQSILEYFIKAYHSVRSGHENGNN